MILVLFTWLIVFLTIFVWGFAASKVVRILLKSNEVWDKYGLDEYFLFGFLILSALTGIISVFAPISRIIFLIVFLLAALFSFILFTEIRLKIINAYRTFLSYGILFKIGAFFLTFFILSAVVSVITFEDTLTYHAQNIQWIQKYPVVPGLGNLHPRFAFNNMFFVVSSVFTFQVKECMIFPLNGLCYLILLVKLLTLFYNDLKSKTYWRGVFYILTLLISLLVFLPNLNTPSPDIFCGILIIYAFVLILNYYGPYNKVNMFHFVLVNLLVFSCITYKISSLFLVPAILFFMNYERIKKVYITLIIASVVILPFLVRNYFLSGYLIYPFPGIDIFNADWKIPIENVIAVKLEIESFAKIIGVPYEEVGKMKINDWFLPWFTARDFMTKMLISVNILSICSLVIMLLKREFYFVKVHLLILINLIFWLVTAPDPRFAYGFLFVGFSFGISYLIKSLGFLSHRSLLKFLYGGLAILFMVIVYKRISFTLNVLKDHSLLITPAPFGTAKTVTCYSNFEYRVVQPEGGWCYNTEIPCVSYPLVDVYKRGEGLADGFKVVQQNP